MVTGLANTIPYYVYSHLQQLQDLEDELAALHIAKNEVMLSGGMLEDLYEFDIEIECIAAAIAEVKALAN